MTSLPPGIGNDAQAAQATAFMREQPFYRNLLRSWGVDPDNPGDFHLNDRQAKQLLDLARQNGVGISDRYEIDRNGAIREGSHKLRNTLIGAGIGAAALTGLGAAGIGPLSGLMGGGGAAAAGGGAGAAAAGGEIPATIGLASGAGLPGAVAAPSMADLGFLGAAGAAGGGGAAGAAGAGASVGSKIANAAKGGVGLKEALSLAGAAPLVAGMFKGDDNGGSASGAANSIPGLNDMIDLQSNRIKSQQPLFNALTQLAMNILPNSAYGALPGRPSVK